MEHLNIKKTAFLICTNMGMVHWLFNYETVNAQFFTHDNGTLLSTVAAIGFAATEDDIIPLNNSHSNMPLYVVTNAQPTKRQLTLPTNCLLASQTLRLIMQDHNIANLPSPVKEAIESLRRIIQQGTTTSLIFPEA